VKSLIEQDIACSTIDGGQLPILAVGKLKRSDIHLAKVKDKL
jgi:hypothetical protein